MLMSKKMAEKLREHPDFLPMNNWLLTDKKVEDTITESLADNPHWAVDAWGLYGKIAKVQARHILERLNEECIDSHYRLGEQLYTRKKCGMSPIRRGECPQCMAEFEKELTGEK